MHKLLQEKKISFIWLIIRGYLAYEWILAGYHKIINPAWVGDKAGTAITGFLQGALTKTSGAHPDVQAWYAFLIQHIALPQAQILSYVIAFGELFVGILLVLGLFTSVAAALGLAMNVSYLLAGTVSINPQMAVLQAVLLVACKTSGWLGLDGLIAYKPKFKKLIILTSALVFLISVIVLLKLSKAAEITSKPVTKMKTFESSGYNFSIEYPDYAVGLEGTDASTKTYIPYCDSSTDAQCFFVDKSKFPGTNFEGAYLKVAITRDLSNCATAEGSNSKKMQKINEVLFTVVDTSNRAAGHQLSQTSYTTRRQGSCILIGKAISTSTFENFPTGSIKKFTSEDYKALDNDLTKSVESFKFTN